MIRRGEFDEPSIGLILCKTRDRIVAEYALRGTSKPIGITTYNIEQKLPDNVRGELPSIEELEAEIEYAELQSPAQKRLDALKEKMAALHTGEIRQKATTPILQEIYDKSLYPLFQQMIQRLNDDFAPLFMSVQCFWRGQDANITDINQLEQVWKKEEFLKSAFDFPFFYRLNGFRKAGTEAFDILLQLDYRIDTYWYGFVISNHNSNPVLKKPYHEQLTPQDMQHVCEAMCHAAMDKIEWELSRITQIL